jgi:hypothetical protein
VERRVGEDFTFFLVFVVNIDALKCEGFWIIISKKGLQAELNRGIRKGEMVECGMNGGMGV